MLTALSNCLGSCWGYSPPEERSPLIDSSSPATRQPSNAHSLPVEQLSNLQSEFQRVGIPYDGRQTPHVNLLRVALEIPPCSMTIRGVELDYGDMAEGVTIPHQIKLDECTLVSGTMSFYNGQAYAAAGATIVSLDPSALAYANGSGSTAKAAKAGTKAFATAAGAEARATGTGSMAYATVPCSNAYAKASDAMAFATALHSKAVASVRDAVAVATAGGAKAVAKANGARAIAEGAAALAVAKVTDAAAFAKAGGAKAVAKANGARAVAEDPAAFAVASADGARAVAIAGGAKAVAEAGGAEAVAMVPDATAFAMVPGATSYAVPGAWVQKVEGAHVYHMLGEDEDPVLMNDIPDGVLYQLPLPPQP